MVLSIEEIAAFCKKKGFVYQNSEIYGSFAGFWDFGPLGVELKNNIKASWWKTFVQSRDDIVGIDGAIITHPKVWKASGHVESFGDVILVCSKCKTRLRADHFIEEKIGENVEDKNAEEIAQIIKTHELKCGKCKSEFEKPQDFNLMFETNVGPVKDNGSVSYLRPETAQLIFADFKQVIDSSRMKLPFGIAQIGKAFRNEISPREFLFRSREFEQMEIEFFVHPEHVNDCIDFDEIKQMEVSVLKAADKESKVMRFSEIGNELTTRWHAYWLALNYKWFVDLGIKEKNLRIREHRKDELAHYAKACFDIEYKFPFGWKEIHGNADRGVFDISQHIKESGKDLAVFDEISKKKVIPYVASEPSQGVERAFLAFMYDAYKDDKERGNIILGLHPSLAPVKIGVFPLVNKLDNEARKIYDLVKNDFVCQFDRSGSVGRRYARADEIGVVYCITVDFESAEDERVTLRDRNSTKQIRVSIQDLKVTLRKLFSGEIEFERAGKMVR